MWLPSKTSAIVWLASGAIRTVQSEGLDNRSHLILIFLLRRPFQGVLKAAMNHGNQAVLALSHLSADGSLRCIFNDDHVGFPANGCGIDHRDGATTETHSPYVFCDGTGPRLGR